MQDDGTCVVEDPQLRFYSDLEKEAQHHWVSELRPFSTASYLAPVTYEAYKYHPVTYLFCEQDQILPLAIQKQMVAESGIEFRIESCTASHSPFLSQPTVVLRVVRDMLLRPCNNLKHSAYAQQLRTYELLHTPDDFELMFSL